MTKAEGFQQDCQTMSKARNQAWQETRQLQNLLKEKQRKIEQLERVIQDFNLHQPSSINAFSPQGSMNNFGTPNTNGGNGISSG